ncbi:hypothetical protein AB0K60_13570 [Thermopolyspora sp. NPDC052614]|uniref:hypothetical protein n=1 Tax=Thermopolyspora sp. NPDC052614 TaxID=3155682 RepID=UPI00341DCF51
MVNRTVALTDYSILDALHARDGACTPHALDVMMRRIDPRGDRHAVPVPARTARHVAAVLAALPVYWLDRPDLDDLRLAAARHTIRRHQCLTRKAGAILRLQAEHDRLQAELDRNRAQLARMTALLTDRHPGPATTHQAMGALARPAADEP